MHFKRRIIFNATCFIDSLETFLDGSDSIYSQILSGDINIDIIKSDINIIKYLNIQISYNFKSYIDLNTRESNNSSSSIDKYH